MGTRNVWLNLLTVVVGASLAGCAVETTDSRGTGSSDQEIHRAVPANADEAAGGSSASDIVGVAASSLKEEVSEPNPEPWHANSRDERTEPNPEPWDPGRRPGGDSTK
jgi:hypothetical protein